MEALNESVCNKLARIFYADSDTVHFLWDCINKKTYVIGGCPDIPVDTENPFIYMLDQGLVDPEFEALYSVFCTKLDEAVLNGIPEGSLVADFRMKFGNSEEFRFCHIYINILKDDSGKATDIQANIRPFTKKEEFDREILAYFTSDKNPAIFQRKVQELYNISGDRKIAFIQFDVERFKLINDNYGASVGDELLAFFTKSLDIICNENQPHCRLTADVYMIATMFDDKSELLDFVHLIESRLSCYKGMEYRFIFGISVITDKTINSRRFGDNATLARQSVKGSALNNVAFYESDMIDSLHKKQTIEEDMHNAIANDEFVMYLQPKYSISTGRIIGAEALARWIHPKKGMISPAEFIPVFEQNGFIIKLDKIIWESACRRIRKWLDCGVKPVPISVNVSREYLSNANVVDIISGLTEKYNIPRNLLELEITESLESEGVRDVVSDFKKNGFTMLMDDFGSGYSSLNMLKTTQFDVLKIDRGFFSEFMESDRGRKIISHTISMSHDIGLDIIAEGVETNEQAHFLSECGCDAAQGFLYSRPIPADDFDKMIMK